MEENIFEGCKSAKAQRPGQTHDVNFLYMCDVFHPFLPFWCAEKAQRGLRVCTLDRPKQGRKTRKPQAPAEPWRRVLAYFGPGAVGYFEIS